mmetsp:Transcript_40937/g.49679  ORF Transcript_40937/g.49679 Transcript_40937/m.49679 type:complete len:163 (+) Transcript_40937:149-637(+)|eukprot:CAMPEP_0197852648 /NCGR_PEP_ID=MMETSP1438-20131217/21147_1 /TAXON_ID=1461541 /ORGANISM="Pterosperma sp., Strain CCMP1384" /LENGTH=162 /DNA_ID=CAMNT_0043466803 /DNA_START=129 /DNA_END=617 /DNA_ORIENTATION=+
MSLSLSVQCGLPQLITVRQGQRLRRQPLASQGTQPSQRTAKFLCRAKPDDDQLASLEAVATGMCEQIGCPEGMMAECAADLVETARRDLEDDSGSRVATGCPESETGVCDRDFGLEDVTPDKVLQVGSENWVRLDSSVVHEEASGCPESDTGVCDSQSDYVN